MDNKEIGNRIKNRRKELNLTLQDVADKVGVASSTIQRYENATISQYKIPVIESIAKALQVNPMWIIGEITNKEIHSPEYERVTYLSNLYFGSVMKWSEDKLLNENDTILLREHFYELLLKYKGVIEFYVSAKTYWENVKENYEAIYGNRLSDKEIKELFLKQELDEKIKSLTDWIEALPNWISRNENDICATKEDYLTPLAAHAREGEFSEEDIQHDLDIMKDDSQW